LKSIFKDPALKDKTAFYHNGKDGTKDVMAGVVQ
jgi:hypothetical protein